MRLWSRKGRSQDSGQPCSGRDRWVRPSGGADVVLTMSAGVLLVILKVFLTVLGGFTRDQAQTPAGLFLPVWFGFLNARCQQRWRRFIAGDDRLSPGPDRVDPNNDVVQPELQRLGSIAQSWFPLLFLREHRTPLTL